MNAAEVLRLYEAGRRDFKGVSLRGQNFKGKDLSGADFSGADIRSTNFTNANLTRANFIQAKAGLQRRWAVIIVFVSLLLSIISGLLSAVTGYFVSLIFDSSSFVNQVTGWGVLTVTAICLFLLFRKGIESVAGAITIAVALAGVGAITIGVTGVGAVVDSVFESEVIATVLAISVAVALAIVGAIAIGVAVALAVAVGGVVTIAVVMAIVIVISIGVGVAIAGAVTLAVALVVILINSYIGWRALKGDKRDAWIRSVAIAFAAIGGTSFRGTTLTDANFSQARLKSTDFRQAVLFRTRWRDTKKLDRVRPGETYLSDLKVCKLLITGNGQGQSYNHLLNLVGINLQGANLVQADFTSSTLKTGTLQGATLTNTYFIGADLNRVNLQDADLSNAQLVQTQLDQADLTGATLTGACIEDWNVNSSTKLAGITCDYVYLKSNQRERRPSQGTFKPGEFAALFQQAVNTVDLIFKDGIDWQAFFQSFQDLRNQYADQDLAIQAIEKKQGGAFVVRVEVPPEADKTAIEGRAKELYASEVKALEAQYEERLRLQGQHLEDARQTIEIERRDKATLMGVMTTMANNQQGPKYDLRNAQFAGGFAETVQGNQVGGTINNEAAETPSLAEAAAEIQDLLKQLEVSNPTATEVDQTAYLNALIPPTKRERFISALKAAGGAAIEEVPYGTVLIALVEGWQKPGE